MTWEHFENAPIVEAILEVGVEVPKPDLEPLRNSLRGREDFGAGGELREFRAEFGLAATSAASTVVGVRFDSTSGEPRRVVQARLNGFALSHVGSYRDWVALRTDAEELWEAYRAATIPVAITSLALRYINRVQIPADASVGTYFNLEPALRHLPEEKVRGFNLQVALEDAARGAVAVVNQRTDPQGTETGRKAIVLDVDVRIVGRYAPESSEIWDRFEELRDFKNEVFFTCVTDSAKQLFRGEGARP